MEPGLRLTLRGDVADMDLEGGVSELEGGNEKDPRVVDRRS